MLGNDDLKSQDEKGSDGGEGNSPSYHEHGDRHNQFNDDGKEEVEERDPSAAQPFASDVKSMEEVPSHVKIDEALGTKEDSVVIIERDLKSEESYEGKDVSFEHIETAKESCYESGKRGGTSNGESLGEKNSKDENYSSIEEKIACHELVKSIDTKNAPIELEETGGNSAAECSINSVKAVAFVSEVENSDTGNVSLEKSVVAPPLEVSKLAVKTNEDNVYPSTDENATTSSLEEPKPKEYDSKMFTSSSASPFTKFTNGAEHMKNSKTPECSENQVLHFCSIQVSSHNYGL